MRERKEQISEELFDEIIDIAESYVNPFSYSIKKKRCKKYCKQKGCIKQSREDEIRNELKKLYDQNYNIDLLKTERALKLQRELIEILDNKEKNK